MRNHSRHVAAILSGLYLSLVGCASAPAPAPAAPSREAKAARTADDAPATNAAQDGGTNSAKSAEQGGGEPAKSEVAPPADVPRDGLRKASRPPMDLLTGNNVVYVLNFASSAKGEAAKAQCEAQGDPAAIRQCLTAERNKLPVESVRFVKDAHGQYWWVTYNRYKGNLLKWHKVQFVPGKEDADTISLTLVGKDKGIAPMSRVPAALKVELPNDYSIVISDPEHGELMYDAKIGLMETDASDGA
jgi:hypothetical protein